jgi:uncharacterized protein YndB with AHSA1/START domain
VDVPVEDAFRLFTESFRAWWPGDESEHSAVEDGAVTVWEPPTRIEFTWRHDGNQTVNVEFEVEADGTRVTLTHYGWETSGVAVCASGFARFVCEQMLVAS